MTPNYKPDGVYFDMPEKDYFAEPRLSSHGIMKLLINPHDYWIHSFMNPDKKETKSKAFSTGKIYEVIYLKGEQEFLNTFCPEFDGSLYPDALKGKPALMGACATLGLPKTGNVPELIQRLQDAVPSLKILDIMEQDYVESNVGKEIIAYDDYHYAIQSYRNLSENPIHDGNAQVVIFWTDEETGVPMKSMLDYAIKDKSKIIDFKTFSNSKSIDEDRLVHSHITNFKYYLQSAVYVEASKHGLFDKPASFDFFFSQTGPVFSYIIKELPTDGLLFNKGVREMRYGINLWRDMYTKFGHNPWIMPVRRSVASDEDFPIYVFE